MKGLFAEFKKFISRGNVVDMAVGVAVAGAFTAIVNAFTKGFIAPLLALLSKDANLAEFKWVIRPAVTELVEGEEVILSAEVAILWGAFVQTIIDFLLIALMLFLVMKLFNHAAAATREMSADLKSGLRPEHVKAAEAKKATEEAAAKAAAEAAAKAAAEAEAARIASEKKAELDAYAAQVEISETTAKLLTEIRDLLKEQKKD